MYKKILVLIVFLMLVSPVLAYDNTTIVCADNVTMLENITVYKDGNQSWYSVYTTCDSGCIDENPIYLTGTLCNPDVFTQYLVLLGIVIMIIIGFAIIRKGK